MSGDFEYVPDEHGHRILVGLTPSEMVEFEQSDKVRHDSSTGLPLISAEGHLQPRREKDGLELLKHALARSALIEGQSATKH